MSSSTPVWSHRPEAGASKGSHSDKVSQVGQSIETPGLCRVISDICCLLYTPLGPDLNFAVGAEMEDENGGEGNMKTESEEKEEGCGQVP